MLQIKTLKLAILYINYLVDVLDGDQDPKSGFQAELKVSNRKVYTERKQRIEVCIILFTFLKFTPLKTHKLPKKRCHTIKQTSAIPQAPIHKYSFLPKIDYTLGIKLILIGFLCKSRQLNNIPIRIVLKQFYQTVKFIWSVEIVKLIKWAYTQNYNNHNIFTMI